MGRLKTLERYGLASEAEPGIWSFSERLEPTLRELGERGDIIRTMQRVMSGEKRELVVLDAMSSQTPVIGRIVDKGLADELYDRAYLVVDGIDGRAHYVPLSVSADLEALPIGGIVQTRAAVERGADRTIASLAVDGVYTNKAPGGVAYRCSFRVTEAAYCIERAMDILAQKLGMDPAELRLKNFVRPEQFPYHSALGWEYDSGDYATAMKKAMESVEYAELRKEQAEKREAFRRGETREIMGIGVSFFTEIVGAGPSKNCDIPGIDMVGPGETRLDPTGAGIARTGTKSQGQGHETTWAQIIASEIGIPADDIMVEEGNTDTAPYGLGTYGSRSTPVAGAAIAMAARKIKAKAQMIAAYRLEVHEDDLEWDIDGFRVKGLPEKFLGMKDICWIAYNAPPPGMEPGL